MSAFHSTVSRKEFIKRLGLTGAGLGALTAAAPVFHDLDEVTSSKLGVGPQHPWYVKEREILDPTCEFDWDQYQRFDNSPENRLIGIDTLMIRDLKWLDEHPVLKETIRLKESDVDTTCVQKKFPSYDHDTRDGAMWAAGIAGMQYPMYGSFLGQFTMSGASKPIYFMNPNELTHPGEISYPPGVKFVETPPTTYPRWNGTPEENLKTLTAAVRHFGGQEVGVVELNEKTKKFIYSRDDRRLGSSATRDIVFEDVDLAYETDTKSVIPNKCNRVIVFTNLQPTEITLTQPGGISGSAVSYSRMFKMTVEMHAFIHALGYQHIDGSHWALSPSVPFGIMAGLGEAGRTGMSIISYKYGNMIRCVNRIITDMPLPLTKPIDSGTYRFCHTCKLCAEACPYNALPMDTEPCWDTEWEDENKIHNYIGGYKAYRASLQRCPRCRACQAVCVFNAKDSAFAHQLVKSIQASNPMFNTFFRNMHESFGYGMQNPNDWWEKNLPSYGVDPAFLY